MAEKAENREARLGANPRSRRPADYEAIEAALMQSARGRWFLAEYARRNRSADTQMLLDAITRLELSVLRPQRQQEADNVLAELIEMSEAIARTRREIAALKPPSQIIAATEELDGVVEATEKATSDILAAAEEVQEVAWTLREAGANAEACNTLDQRATDIYTACSFQDITGQRTAKVVRLLHFVEERVKAMIDIWGFDEVAFDIEPREACPEMEDAGLLDGPGASGEALRQEDVDAMLSGGKAAGTAVRHSFSNSETTAGGATPERPQGQRQKSAMGEPAPGFEQPRPLTLSELHAAKRAALFG